MPRRKLKVCFDCDETLWLNDQYAVGGEPNAPVVAIFKALQRMPHIELFVWSHGGQEWAEEVAKKCGLTGYKIIEKPFPVPTDKSCAPDIAFDDIDDMGKVTIFVE